ncbi:hypothetical protein LTS18_004896 [Coniosporium uncinatum]|uniref:Uncharacterized protein n=1 Tax=Coniosporium uncinatum TaxID=93489 RepID=A0ACC3D585_9PEZI|nr:hypothetical protein LTS18_004896 [Coniosporium uncinatum]
MKAPADCPGEIGSKDERKKLKSERQEAARTANPPTNGAAADSHQDNLALRPVSTADSMNTLSSGYSATAQRSISGAVVPTTSSTFGDENEVPGPAVPVKPSAAAPGSVKRNRVMAPPPMSYVSSNGDGGDGLDSSMAASPTSPQRQKGKMMYAYQKNGDGEISVEEGKDVTVLEPDDGGWTKVRAGFLEGLVPTSYLELTTSSPSLDTAPPPINHSSRPPIGYGRPESTYSASSVSLAGSENAKAKKKGPAVAPKRGAKKLKYVEALYAYEARGEGELGMQEGERFVLVQGDQGDGWAEVERSGGVVGSVPANYLGDV